MTVNARIDAKPVRKALRESLPSIDQAATGAESPAEFTYVPPSHAKALDPDNSVVEGIRGAGKSFWWSALSSDEHRMFVMRGFPEARMSSDLRVEQGFGAPGASATGVPSQDVLATLVKNVSPRAIWRAVAAHKLGFAAPYPQRGSWPDRVRWVSENPEVFDELLLTADRSLDAKGQTTLILFDALDRMGDDWPSIRPLARGLLQIALDMRATRRMRFKVFVRPDMLEDREIVGFPDASKLLARKASLSWRRADLYGLLFQFLGNAKGSGTSFRAFSSSVLRVSWVPDGNAWLVPPILRNDEEAQERVFIELAGKAMAAGPSGYKRGKPYSWLVNHLQDGRDQVSPRSFLAAVRTAAENTAADSPLVLDPKSIQAGVQAASRIRVNEITHEDYPWVESVMEPLRGQLSVPCATDDMAQVWRKNGTLKKLEATLQHTVVKLPPQHLDDGPEGVLNDLDALGLIQRLTDGRVQMPDVYRIAFGLGRRGGVKPLR